jgi:hypothetical protein
MHMRTLSLIFFVLTLASCAIAAPEASPSLTTCKSDLKAWSVQKTEALTIKQLNEHMNEMFACAQETKKHEKQMRTFLDEFYRTHSELADRAFDFITRHDLQGQFGEEEAAGTKPKN